MSTGSAIPLDRFGRHTALLRTWLPALGILTDQYFRLQVEGLENIPQEGQVLFVANHGGALPWDVLVLLTVLSRAFPNKAVRPLIEDSIVSTPFIGMFLNRLGCVRASQENAMLLLKKEPQEQLLVAFPEGILGSGKLYSQKHQLQRFGRGGFVSLAHKAQIPIVPVTILGAEDTAPLLTKITPFFRSNTSLPYLPITPLFPLLGLVGFMPLPARWRIHFAEPVWVPEISTTETETSVRQESILNVATTVKTQIQQQLDKMVAARGSAWM
jgi:1-acyl-sn-glycerol-3-phosphate acyltransferase